MKYASDGTVLWANSALNYSEPIYSNISNSVASDGNGNVYITGSFNNHSLTFGTIVLNNFPNAGNDIFIVKYAATGTGENELFEFKDFNISPNPTLSTLTLTMPYLKNNSLFITTLTGNVVGTYCNQNTNLKTIDVNHLEAGVYFVTLKSDENVITKKFV